MKSMILAALLLGMALVAWAMFAGKPPVSVTILSLTTNHLDNETAALLGTRTYSAHIAATNNSRRSFRYWADDSVNSVLYDILRETPQGWKALGSFRCGVGLTEHTLLPSQGVTFEAFPGSAEQCKVGFTYLDGKPPNPIWQRFPSWITQRMPWLKPSRTATTDVIDLRGPGT